MTLTRSLLLTSELLLMLLLTSKCYSLVKTQWRGRESGPTATKRTGRRGGSIHVTWLPPTPIPKWHSWRSLGKTAGKLGCQIQGRSPGGEIGGELRVLKDRVTQLPQTARCMSWVQCENFTEIWTQHPCTLAILEHIMRKWVRERLEFPSVSQQTEISKQVHWDKWVHSISVKLFTFAAFRV